MWHVKDAAAIECRSSNDLEPYGFLANARIIRFGSQESRAGKWLYALTVSLMVTFLGVLAISFMMSRLHFGSDVLRGLCLTLEAVSAFAGAMLLGKRMMSRRFLWGLLLGLIYFLVLFLQEKNFSNAYLNFP